jgi:hypothetical protein
VRRRVSGGSACASRGGSSGSSEESECGESDFGGVACLLADRPARSVRADEADDDDVLCAVATLGGGCVVRAREDLRGDIAERLSL